MKLTHAQVIALVGNTAFNVQGALVGIHGHQQSVKIDDKNVMETIPHTLGLGARMSIALAFAALSKAGDAFEKVRQGLVTEYTAKAAAAKQPFTVGSPVHDECLSKIQELLAMTCEVGGLKKIKLTDLNVDENKLNPMLLVTLMPLLEGV